MSSNTTSKVITTKAGEALIAQMQAENKVLVIDKFIFANVPNRPDFPQREDLLPTEYVVHESAVHEQGRMTENSVIYSTTIASNVGPFTFNWSGLYCSEHNTLVAINFPAAVDKTVDGPGVTGNTLVRSFVLEYKGIAETTNITVDPASWQYDAHKRMSKMDNDSAQAIIDQNGKDWFIDDGFIVTPQSTAYNIKAGAGYVSGHRITLDFDRIVQAPIKPSFIYVDAYREGNPTGEWVTKFNFVVSPDEKDDYTDAQGVQHFVSKIAQVMEDGSVGDMRPSGITASRDYVKTELGKRQYFAPAYIKDLERSSDDMNKLIKKVQDLGGGTICLGDFEYGVNPVIRQSEADGYDTGWLVPYKQEQGQGQSHGITFNLTAGTKIKALSNNMMTLRGANNFTEINGNGVFSSIFKNVLHIGFVPEDMDNSTTLCSQQFCKVDPCISFVGGFSCVVFQPGPTINGAASGSYYHRVGFNFYNVDYPVWFKQPLHASDNLTTTTFLNGINGHVCISSGKFEACDAHMINCAFEGMSGEVVDFVTKGHNQNTNDNCLKISHTDFEVFKSSSHLERWGIQIGLNVKFVGNNVDILETRSPNWQYGKQVYGSYGTVNVKTHVVEHVAGKGESQKKIACIISEQKGFDLYSLNSPVYVEVPKFTFVNAVNWGQDFTVGGSLAYGGQLKRQHTEYGYILMPRGDISLPNGGYGYGCWLCGDNLEEYSPYFIKDKNHTPRYRVKSDGSVLNSSGTYGVISDPRTKENFTDARDYTDDLMKLRIGTYVSKINNKKQIGLLATELEKVFPALVDNIGDVILSKDEVVQNCLIDKSTPLLYILIKVVQEQQKTLETLKVANGC